MCKEKVEMILAKGFEFLAEGGNSWVYAKGQTAIKVYRRFSDLLRYKRFCDEVKTLAKLQKIEGVVQIHESNLPDKLVVCSQLKKLNQLPYFGMPLYLGNLAEQVGKLPKDDGRSAVLIMLRLVSIVEQLHRLGIAHRDLKPENILGDDKGEYFIADFGMCLDLESERGLTPAGELVGSVSYRAPEYLRGRLDTSDQRPGDIFSLGRIMYALIFGTEPHGLTDNEFASASVLNLGKEFRNPMFLDEIIKASTSIDPMRRIGIKEFRSALESWLSPDKTVSNSAVIDKVLNHPSTIQQFKILQKVSEIQAMHKRNMSFLSHQLSNLTSNWQEIAQEYAKRFGQADSFYSSIRGYGDFNPEELGIERFGPNEPEGFRVRLNLGNTNASPMLDLGFFISYNPNQWDQKYLVVATYDDGSGKILVTRSQTIEFSYKIKGISLQIAEELREAYLQLEELLHNFGKDNGNGKS